VDIQFPQHHLGDYLLFNVYFWHLCSKSGDYRYMDFVPEDSVLKSSSVMPPPLFFLLKIILAIKGLLWLHTNFCKEYYWNFNTDYILNVWVSLESISILVLAIHENGMPFLFFFFFFWCLQFLSSVLYSFYCRDLLPTCFVEFLLGFFVCFCSYCK
jgi:hypothetical protein